MLAEEKKHIGNRSRGKKIKKRKIIKKKKTYKGGKLFVAIVFLMVGLYLISRYVGITHLRTEISQLEIKKEELQKNKLNLEAKLEGIKSSESVSQEAMIKLGMHYPVEGQIVYVSVPEKIEKKEETKDIKSQMGDLVDKIQIFFRRF